MKCRKSTKTTPGAAKNDPKRSPRRPKKRSRTTRRKKDRTKTIFGPSWTAPGPICVAQPPPPGAIWEAKTAPKSIPKRSKIEAKNQDEKNRSKTILDPSWGDLGPSWVPSWADLDLKIVLSPRAALVFLKNHFFDVKTVRRRLWDQLWPTKAPKRPKMTPKTEPKSTPRRSKIDVKIDIKNDTKTKRTQPVLTRGVWVGTPPPGTPREAPQGPRGGGPGPMGPLKSHRFSKKCIYIY